MDNLHDHCRRCRKKYLTKPNIDYWSELPATWERKTTSSISVFPRRASAGQANRRENTFLQEAGHLDEVEGHLPSSLAISLSSAKFLLYQFGRNKEMGLRLM